MGKPDAEGRDRVRRACELLRESRLFTSKLFREIFLRRYKISEQGIEVIDLGGIEIFGRMLNAGIIYRARDAVLRASEVLENGLSQKNGVTKSFEFYAACGRLHRFGYLALKQRRTAPFHLPRDLKGYSLSGLRKMLYCAWEKERKNGLLLSCGEDAPSSKEEVDEIILQIAELLKENGVELK